MTTTTLAFEPSEVSVASLRAFYAQPLARRTLIATSVLLTYVGGGAMFWLHAIHRGERGPAINHWFHWLLDSTLGFVALTPVLVVILPIALYCVGLVRRRPRATLALYAVAVGMLFSVATAPGPLLHAVVAGAGTPLAEAATEVFGQDAAVAAGSVHAASHTALGSVLAQLAVGLPVYVVLSWMAMRIALLTRQRGSTAADIDEPKLSLACTA